MSEANYEKLKILGGGSFGQVYKARRKDSQGQICAMKYISKQKSRRDIHDARSEIYILERLKHPNIVQLLESIETEQNIILICEYAVKELFRAMREEPNGRFCEEKVRHLSSQISSALFYLHSRTVLHRDLKPQNILMLKDGTVKICDFGFSRIMGETYYARTILGTLYYMAPELLTEYTHILYTEKVDLWALGCIIYELFVGVPAFASKSLNHIRLMQKNIPLPRDGSIDLQDLLVKLLSCDPHRRIPWPHILKHPWFKGTLNVSAEDLSRASPYTKPEIAAKKSRDHYMKVRRVTRYRHRSVPCRDMLDGDEVQAVRDMLDGEEVQAVRDMLDGEEEVQAVDEKLLEVQDRPEPDVDVTTSASSDTEPHVTSGKENVWKDDPERHEAVEGEEIDESLGDVIIIDVFEDDDDDDDDDDNEDTEN